MRTRALALLAALATLAFHPAQAQRAPWPSEIFNPAKRPNVAGQFDYYLLVLSWSPTHCSVAEPGRDELQCARTDGLRYGFVLHGLWPQYERGYPERCATRWRPFVPQPVIDGVLDVMPSKGLIIHQYRSHGTCSGLQPAPYFALARKLFNRVRIPDRYRNPFETQFVSPRGLSEEFMRANPGLRPDMMVVTCGGPGNRLDEVLICMSKDGRARTCGRDVSRNKQCRASTMHVPPVRSTRREGATSHQAEQPLPRPRVIQSPGPF